MICCCFVYVHTVWDWKTKAKLASLKAEKEKELAELKKKSKDDSGAAVTPGEGPLKPLPGETVLVLDENLPDGALEDLFKKMREEEEAKEQKKSSSASSFSSRDKGGRGGRKNEEWHAKRKKIKVSKLGLKRRRRMAKGIAQQYV